jgi:hypothetical protein
MKKILITFGDSKYKRSLELLKNSAYQVGKVDSVLIYDDLWLKKTKFYDQHKTWILDAARGAGFFAWKPYIIQNAMQHNQEGDVIIYSDAGLEVVGDLTPLYELAAEKERLIFKLPPHEVPYHKAKQWTKGDCFEIMKCNEAKYWEADMSNGAVSVWKKTNYNSSHINEWINYAIIPQCITDIQSIFPNKPEFKDHRHDQSILSNLRVKYDWELFRDPTQFGNIELESFSNSPYKQLFNHHRKKL